MNGETISAPCKLDSLKKIYKEFSCRLCLYRHEKNSRISSQSATDSDLMHLISKYLPAQITKEEQYPLWICKFCEQSLESFHKFYSTVQQIHESLSGLLAGISNGNEVRLDEELDAIERTVGFGRVKKVSGRSKKTDNVPVRRTSKRAQARRAKIQQENVNSQPPEECEEFFFDSKNLEDIVSSPSTQIKTRGNVGREPVTVIKTEIEESAFEEGYSVPTAVQNEDIKDDDLSSLEDQDWVGQGFNFDPDSDGENTWKTSEPLQGKRKSSRRRKSNLQRDKDFVEDFTDRSDHSDEDLSLQEQSPKKVKLRITATHGSEPKPKVPAAVRKLLREEMNARFVDFYGITCDICAKDVPSNSAAVEPVKYQTFDELCAHMQKEHNERGYVKCCTCTMRERKRAERHMLLHTEPGSIFKCNICGKQLSSQQSFRCHILLHLPDAERPFQCNICDRGFVSKTDLSSHKRQHLPDEKRLQYTCDICGSRFSYETGLMIHKQRVHDNIRPHLCDLCAKSFSSRCDMERHRAQIHGNVKREQCPECGKWFKGQSILRTHMQRHKGALFKCQYCDKTYNVRSSWKAHLVMHSDEKPHQCPICEKSFKLPGTLKMHLNQHTGDLPYACPFCPKKFASSGNYYTHRKRMHASEVAKLKEATEAALASSGLPPPLVVPPPTVTQSISEAIARTKEIVAAKAKEAATLLPSEDDVLVNFEESELIPSVSEDVVDMIIDPPNPVSSVVTLPGSSDLLGTQVVAVTVPQDNTNSVILTQPNDTMHVSINSVNESNRVVHVIPSLKMPSSSSSGTLVAGSLKLVRIISPDGTSKLVFLRDDDFNLGNNLSLGKISQ